MGGGTGARSQAMAPSGHQTSLHSPRSASIPPFPISPPIHPPPRAQKQLLNWPEAEPCVARRPPRPTPLPRQQPRAWTWRWRSVWGGTTSRCTGAAATTTRTVSGQPRRSALSPPHAAAAAVRPPRVEGVKLLGCCYGHVCSSHGAEAQWRRSLHESVEMRPALTRTHLCARTHAHPCTQQRQQQNR